MSVLFKDALRYSTLDDYGIEGNKIWFEIKDTGNLGYNLILLIHAIIEFLLTQGRGIPVALIDRFDADHPESDEPGDEMNSPYRNEHCVAVGIERILCAYLNIPWKAYEETLIKSLGDDR